MTDIQTKLLSPDVRPILVRDCVELVDTEVKSKSGLSGLAVKGAYAIVKKLKPGIIKEAVDNLLDEFVTKLSPFLTQYGDSGASDLGGFFGGKKDEIANALLGVTDARAAKAKQATIKKAYEKLRPTGVKHVTAAVPGIARVLTPHL